MEMFELVLLLLGAVLVSSVLDQMMPRVSLPLVQIALGIVIAVIAGTPLQVNMDPELFLVLFIAPLLFDEARHSNKRALWQNKGAVLSLAVGLVLATVLVVGFVLHWIEPSIPLAAAFAIGAALGPTDAVAVTALGKDISLTKRQKTLLSGEALINDASGVVSFQFAIAAAVTGTFSLLEATATFLVSFFGGIALGLALGLIATFALRFIRSRGFESATVHVVFEVFTPFIVFLVAESFHVSGILARGGRRAAHDAPAAAARHGSLRAPADSLRNRVGDAGVRGQRRWCSCCWGCSFPRSSCPRGTTGRCRGWSWRGWCAGDGSGGGRALLWVFAMEALEKDRAGEGRRAGLGKAQAKSALVTTLAGPKGAVTLSIAMTIPFLLSSGEAFPHRSALIFIASGVILCTLLLANFVVPLLAPTPETPDGEEGNAASVDVLEAVVRELKARQTPQTAVATAFVVRQYEERIKRLRRQNTSAPCLVELRADVLEQQRALLEARRAEGLLDEDEAQRHLGIVDRSQKLLLRAHTRHATFGEAWGKAKVAFMRFMRNLTRTARQVQADEAERERERQVRVELEKCAIAYLEPKTRDADAEVAEGAAMLIAESRATLAALESPIWRGGKDGGALAGVAGVAGVAVARESAKAGIADVEAEALRLELDEIQRMRESGRIDRATASDLREEVYLLQMTTGD